MTRVSDPNLDIVMLAVEQLGELTDEMVFLGGSVTGLLITDQAAPPVRETRDIDVIVEVSSLIEYHKISKKLRAIGFREDQSEDAPICRWLSERVILDVMPTDSSILGFSNRWYEAAMNDAVQFELPNGKVIRLVTAPYFLATKLEAFEGRGKDDYLASHDMEDLISVIDGRPEVIDEVLNTDEELKRYFIEKFSALLKAPRFLEALPGMLPGDESSQARIPIILKRMKNITSITDNN